MLTVPLGVSVLMIGCVMGAGDELTPEEELELENAGYEHIQYVEGQSEEQAEYGSEPQLPVHSATATGKADNASGKAISHGAVQEPLDEAQGVDDCANDSPYDNLPVQPGCDDAPGGEQGHGSPQPLDPEPIDESDREDE